MSPPASASASHVGLKREHQEDAHFEDDFHGAFVVADGMGGHNAGEVASRIAGETALARLIASPRNERPEAAVRAAIADAHAAVTAEGQRALSSRGLGTTLVVLFARNGRFVVGHVGDSRAYLVRASGRVERLTKDHNLAEIGRPNVLTRGIGLPGGDVADVAEVSASDGDRFVLCTDGLHGVVGDAEIGRAVSSMPPAEAASALVAATLAGGAPDNVTLTIVRADPFIIRARKR